jgi:uncharacterized metal-binding protein YceD (DUF177 family)
MPKGIPKAGHRKPGAGKPKGQPTTTIAFRVPVTHKARINLACKRIMNQVLNEESCSLKYVRIETESGKAIGEKQKDGSWKTIENK